MSLVLSSFWPSIRAILPMFGLVAGGLALFKVCHYWHQYRKRTKRCF